MISEFRVGGIYRFNFKEDLYLFIDKQKLEYDREELAPGNYECIEPGTIVTYIKEIIELAGFKKNNSYWEYKKFRIPVFYYKDSLVTTLTPYESLVKHAEEVVDEPP